MFIIADSGSTKTTWTLIDHDTLHKKESEGLNPFFVDAQFISKTFSDVLGSAEKQDISKIFFYGAGCANDEKCKEVKKGLTFILPHAEMFVYSDLLAAARALFHEQKGWAAILGTGSNVAYFDGKELFKHTPSLGFILGDEGSGAYLGKMLLQAILYNKMDKELIALFFEKYKINQLEILSHVYSKPHPNRYLSQFTFFLIAHEKHQVIQQLIYNAFEEFLQKHVLPFIGKHIETIGFVGSVAYSFKEILMQACLDHNLNVSKIVKSPMDGLIEYHTKVILHK
jgi:N-acetylglucosamine kinase-like BadF-type ATPase